MKKSIVVLLGLFSIVFVFPLFSDNSSASIELKKNEGNEASTNQKSAPTEEYGTGANSNDAIKISEVLESPDKFTDKEITVSGLIVDVCPKRGCWMLLASDEKFQTLRIKVNDGEMVFPLSARGRQGTAKGKLAGNKLTQNKAIKYYKHLAEEKGEKFDPASVTGPVTIYMLRATGAAIK